MKKFWTIYTVLCCIFCCEIASAQNLTKISGTVLDEKVCPAVPEKEGYTGHWKLPTTPITEDTEIVAEYVTTTPPVDTDDSFSVMLPVIFMMLAVAFGAVWMRRKKSI